ncbi:MAG: GTPase, partial [Lachnospiraceae bacterium]|nr:GTPase [Lachnospiraceae bacterium]
EDMAFLGYACEYETTDALENQQWVKVTAQVEKAYFSDYEGEGPVLHAISVEQAKAPKEEVISFV